MDTVSSSSRIATGIALIVAPLIGFGLKMVSAGYLVFFAIYGPVVILVVGYIIQVIIAWQGFLSGSRLFGASIGRATAAAWVTSVAAIATGLFLSDGTDAGYGSTVQKWMGSYGPNAQAVHQATDGWSDWLGAIVTIIWVASYIWLFVEWILALRVRRAPGQ